MSHIWVNQLNLALYYTVPFLDTVMKLYGRIALIALLLLTGINFCKKKEAVPEAIQIKYQANAQKFCKAITTCMKKEIEVRLKKSPKRRDMVLKRMNRDLCRKNQFNLLGSLHTNPMGPEKIEYNKKLYIDYEICANSLSEATNCNEVKKRYNEVSECRRIRKKE